MTTLLEKQGQALAKQTEEVNAAMSVVQGDIKAVQDDVEEVQRDVAKGAVGKTKESALKKCSDLQDDSGLEPTPGHYFVVDAAGDKVDNWCDYKDGVFVSLGGDSKTKGSAGSGCKFLKEKFGIKLANSKSTTFYAKDQDNKGRVTPVFCDKTGGVDFEGGTTREAASAHASCALLGKAYSNRGLAFLFVDGVYWHKSAAGKVGPMKCTKAGSTWTTKSSGIDQSVPYVASSDHCAKMFATFNAFVEVAAGLYWFAPSNGAKAVALLCQRRGGSMAAVNDGKSEAKPLSSCDQAYQLLPHLVESQVESDNEFFLKTSKGVSAYKCSLVNGIVTTAALWAGSGTTKEPYTQECSVAAPMKDAKDKRAPKNHYAVIKIGNANAKTYLCQWSNNKYTMAGVNNIPQNALAGNCNDMVQAGAQGLLQDGNYQFKATDTTWASGTFQTYCDLNTVPNKGFALIAKFSKNNFCYYSGNWHKNDYNSGKSRDKNMPGHRAYDTTNEAYGRMAVKDLYFTGHRNNNLKKASIIGFEKAACPRKLMTKQDVKITTYPHWDTWKLHFGSGRQRGPQFMRDAKWEKADKPYRNGYSQICRSERTGSTRRPSGCGKHCVFCFHAGDGNCCSAGCGFSRNDVSFGLGLSGSFCGGGDSGDCSASGNWADSNNKVIVWGL